MKQVIHDATGKIISESRNLRGIRRYVGQNAIKVLSLSRGESHDDNVLEIEFKNGSTFKTSFASWSVLCDFVLNWRNAYGAPIRCNGRDIGKLCKDMVKLPSVKELAKELAYLKSHIDDDFKDEEGNIGIDITLAGDHRGWTIQTGDNSFTGSAYSYPHWAVGFLQPDTNCRELANDLLIELRDTAFNALLCA